MLLESLLNNISRKGIDLSLDEAQAIPQFFSQKKYRKNQYILQEGEVAQYDQFVVKGLTRTYSMDEKGHEHIVRFAPEDWWTGDLASFLSQKPTKYNVDCLEDTEVLRVTPDGLESLCERIPKMNKYFRILYQRSIASFNQRVSSAISLSASDRYQEFIQKFAAIHHRVPDRYIASYLGITPQSLSRIRGQSTGRKS